MTAANLAAAVRELLDLGLTIRDIAEILRVHERAIAAIITG
jgi:plasmid maintenance system antidote protein VapI